MLALGSDQGGYALNRKLSNIWRRGRSPIRILVPTTRSPWIIQSTAKAVAKSVASGECEKGILICGTGIGISITANKVKGIRAALCTDCFMRRRPGCTTMPISWHWAEG